MTEAKCAGTTKKGKACGNRPKAGTEFCARHTPDRVHPLERIVAERDGNPIEARTMIMEAIKAGVSFKDAAKAAGISERSFYEYRSIGQEWVPALETGDSVPSDLLLFAQFARDLEKADGEAIVSAIAIIKAAARGRAPKIVDGVVLDKGAKPEWMAAAWLAERKNPADYARPSRVEHTGKDGGPIKTDRVADLSKLSVAERRTLRELQRKMNSENTQQQEAT